MIADELNRRLNVGATRASPEAQHAARKDVRLMREVYTQAGYYYVTVCCNQRRSVLGTVSAGVMGLSSLGQTISAVLLTVPEHHDPWLLDCFVVMPNHLHALLFKPEGTDRAARNTGLERASLSTVVGSFKSAATRISRQFGLWGADPLFQRGFYDHVVRSEQSLFKIREYILYNPLLWDQDYLNATRGTDDPFEGWIRSEDTLPPAFWFSGDARVAPTQEGR